MILDVFDPITKKRIAAIRLTGKTFKALSDAAKRKNVELGDIIVDVIDSHLNPEKPL
jgi:hypothetical protein